MTSDEETCTPPLVMRVEQSDHPVAAAMEADAALAARRYRHYTVRGPLFGVAAQCPDNPDRWEVVCPVTDASGQQARDRLQSALFFRAKDDIDDPAQRRRLVAGVAVLEKEPVDELVVDGRRYRVVRADEFLYLDDDGPETARPTDPQPARPEWDPRIREPEPDEGHVIDHTAASGLMAGAERLALRDLAYRASSYPEQVRRDSERALETHPGVVLLPASFRVVERCPGGWEMTAGPFATAHHARTFLYAALKLTFPMLLDLDEEEKAEYARIAEEWRSRGEGNRLQVGEKEYSIARIGRLVRIGPDGPEGPRPSDIDPHGPMRMHPRMDDDGTLHDDDEEYDLLDAARDA
ncbi:DUF5954 family protein [Streptomyces lonarensis]|uniref:PE-PGRS family protein n=2 Tax=Streptomyces lonarensis TaxID=700599 RepID=A0A7X6CYA5_9ACTN|nr:DUF5954 family protein [Streptomyces lonarensis]NJQ04794.1 hypothetical protein [Streptomyces lonarensis]